LPRNSNKHPWQPTNPRSGDLWSGQGRAFRAWYGRDEWGEPVPERNSRLAAVYHCDLSRRRTGGLLPWLVRVFWLGAIGLLAAFAR